MRKIQGLAQRSKGWRKDPRAGTKIQGLAQRSKGWHKDPGAGAKIQGLAQRSKGWRGAYQLFMLESGGLTSTKREWMNKQ